MQCALETLGQGHKEFDQQNLLSKSEVYLCSSVKTLELVRIIEFYGLLKENTVQNLMHYMMQNAS